MIEEWKLQQFIVDVHSLIVNQQVTIPRSAKVLLKAAIINIFRIMMPIGWIGFDFFCPEICSTNLQYQPPPVLWPFHRLMIGKLSPVLTFVNSFL